MQIQNDLDQGVVGAVAVPPDYVGQDLVIPALVANVGAMIRADRKVIALKQLQVRLLLVCIEGFILIHKFLLITFTYMQGSYMEDWISK